jgi:hypothetical protein
MTFEEQILHVQDITPVIRKTRINSMNLDIFTEEDFLPSPTSEVFGLISHNFPRSSCFFRYVFSWCSFFKKLLLEQKQCGELQIKKKKKEENVFSSSNFHFKESFTRES